MYGHTALIVAVILCLCSCKSSAPPLWGYIDAKGNFRIQPRFASAARFSEGLAPVLVNGKWGYVDQNGNFIISPQFGYAEPFSDGLALVTSASYEEYWDRTTLFGYIDKTGEYAIPPRFNWARPFSDELAEVCIGACRGDDYGKAKIGYIQKNGKFVISPRFSGSHEFSEGLAAASTDPVRHGLAGPYGYIDSSGEFVIPRRFLLAGPFSSGLAATEVGYIDRFGEVVIRAEPAQPAGDFSDGIAATVIENGIAFINSAGKILLTVPSYHVGRFSEGLAPVCMRECGPSSSGPNWGYIDKTGEFAIEPQFGKARPFSEGLAAVCAGCYE